MFGKEYEIMKSAAAKTALLSFMLITAQVMTANAFGQENKAASGAPKLMLGDSSHDFGKVAEGTELSHTFKVKNEGASELIIRNVSPACGCTASDFTKQIAPGK